MGMWLRADNHIVSKGISLIMEALEKNSAVTSINLGVAILRFLSVAAKWCDALLGNAVGDGGAKSAAAMLGKNSTIKSLCLECDKRFPTAMPPPPSSVACHVVVACEIGDGGATQLAGALEKNSTLVSLEMGGLLFWLEWRCGERVCMMIPWQENKIGDEPKAALAAAMAKGGVAGSV